MGTYYMGENVHRDMTIVGESGITSDYQDLIDDYLAGGGMVHKIEQGVRSTGDEIPTWDDKLDFEIEAKEREARRGGLFDMIDKGRELVVEEDLFDNPEEI